MTQPDEKEWLQKYLYLKDIKCPCCQEITKMTIARKSKARIEGRDSDFFIRYRELNLYFYEIWVCQYCGYAALSNEYHNIKRDQIEKIKKNITLNWQPRANVIINDVDTAIDRYKLALLCYTQMDALSSQLGTLCLKLAWMYRLKIDINEENRFLALALKQLDYAYYVEPLPFYGLDKDHIMYLLGEIHRRLHHKSEALKSYSQVLASREADQKLKELVRDQRELMDK
ncbi:MAG: DUF2225 domain-containing protein [Eubacteriales bacterium]